MRSRDIFVILFALVITGVIVGCAPQVKVVEVEVTAAPQVNVVEVTATPAPTSTPAPPPTITVCASDCDFATIQAAVDDADTVVGTIINVTDAVHTEGDIIIGKDVVIQGQGVAHTVVQAYEVVDDADDRVFFIAEGATVTIRDITIRHGHPDLEPDVRGVKRTGGGIANLGALRLENCAIRDNIASSGGGILNRGDLTIINCTISDNFADGIDEGRDCSSGAGIRSVEGAVRITDSTFSGNHSSHKGGSGGALHVACNSTMVVTNSTVSGNNAGTVGGGAHVRGTLKLVHCTVSDNSAEGHGRGGDMIVPSGGGIYINDRGALHLVNTIVANNSGDGDCVIKTVGTIADNVNSMDSDGSCNATFSGDPILSVLADNGGDNGNGALTHALLPGSPAIDAIECTLTADQRGIPRPQGAACDIGAFESGEK